MKDTETLKVKDTKVRTTWAENKEELFFKESSQGSVSKIK